MVSVSRETDFHSSLLKPVARLTSIVTSIEIPDGLDIKSATRERERACSTVSVHLLNFAGALLLGTPPPFSMPR